MQILNTRVMVLGAGAGGFGAAYVLSHCGIPTVVVDKNSGFGGTAVFGGVSCFEPGVSLGGVHTVLAEMLLNCGGGEVQKTVPSQMLFNENDPINNERPLPPYPWGLSVKVDEDYEETLKRCLKFRSGYGECRRFMTDGEALSRVMHSLINNEHCKTLFGYEYMCCESENGNITSVTVCRGDEKIKICADYFIDCSGSIVLARDAGCEYTFGDANGNISGINGVSFVFRVSKRRDAVAVAREELPEDTAWVQNRMRMVSSCFNTYPNGDINVNMLPTLTGEEWFTFGKDAVNIGKSRVFSYWEYMQKTFRLEEYKIIQLFEPAVREDYRLIGRRVLTLEDIKAPMAENGDYIAIADHSIDIHGVKDAVSGELEHPYGIPLDCARAKEFENLFVACRGASFTHTAASSARLTRTMMSMGEGVAKYICKLINKD